MKGAIFAVVLAATGGLVNAQIYGRQNFGAEPACAIPCLQAAISSAGCAANDEGCQCGTAMAAIGGYAAGCLVASCDPSDLASAESVGFALCSAYSASLTAVSATTTTSAPTTSSTSSGSSTPSSTSTTVASTTAVKTTTTSAPATTATTNSTLALSKTSTTPPPVSSTGGANAMMAGLGGVAGLVAAFVAAL